LLGHGWVPLVLSLIRMQHSEDHHFVAQHSMMYTHRTHVAGSTTPALKSSGTAAPADHNPLQHPAPVPGTAAASRELAAVRVHEMTSSKGSRSLPHGVLGRLLGGGRGRRPEDVEFNWNGQILHKTNKKHALCFFLC
jgi:hypothetical protein